MSGQATSDVEMASLLGGGGDDGGVDGDGEDGDVAPSADEVPGAPHPGSSLSSGDVLRCLLFFLGGIFATAALSAVFAVVALLALAAGENPARVDSPDNAAAANDDGVISPTDVPWTRMRWRPTEGVDNCVPGFRMANATIHCGANANNVPLETDDKGTQFCGGVRMEPNFCVLPEEGTWQEEASAPPLPRRFGVRESSAPRCETMEDVRNGTWEGPTFDQEWVPEACGAVPLSPFAWTENAGCQTTITMMGDSHIRNLFTATVNGLRGVEAFAEAHGTEAEKGRGIAETYEWRWNRDGSASDRAAIHRDTTENELDLHDRCTCEDEAKRCLRIVFIWAPSFRDQMDQLPYVKKWRSDLVIVEPGNAYEQETVLPPEWTAALDDLLRESERAELGVLHFVWGRQPARERGEALQQWITNETVPNRKSYLPQSDLASPEGTGLQGRATFHFACGLGQERARNDRIAAAEPCTDLSDTAQLRALITVHFGALSNGGRGPRCR